MGVFDIKMYLWIHMINKQSNSKLLKFAEACAIRIYRPNLCIQKEMVDNLSLPWWDFMYILMRLFIIKVLICFIFYSSACIG